MKSTYDTQFRMMRDLEAGKRRLGGRSKPWLNTITLNGFSDASPDDWPRYAKHIANELKKDGFLNQDSKLRAIAFKFENLGPDEHSADDFDDLLDDLYDWGDKGRRLWVETFKKGDLSAEVTQNGVVGGGNR